MTEAVQCNQAAIRKLAVTSENAALLGPQCWSLLLADWVLGSGHSKVSLGK